MTITMKLGNLMKRLVCITALTCIVVASTGCASKQVMSDNTMTTYSYNESLAKRSLDVLMVYNSESYEQIKTKLKDVLSAKVYDEYFSSKTYNGYNLTKPQLTILTTKGDFTDDTKMVFKLDITFSSGGITDTATMLVTIENGLVTYIERV